MCKHNKIIACFKLTHILPLMQEIFLCLRVLHLWSGIKIAASQRDIVTTDG